MSIDQTLIVFGQVILALFLGILLGTERSFAGKTAGMRTFALVSMGSTLLIIISRFVASTYVGILNFDPMRLAAGIIMGIGFIAGGVIFLNPKDSKINGLTTAAGIWVASGIGIAVGFELYLLAIFTALLTVFTFTILWIFEEKVVGLSRKD